MQFSSHTIIVEQYPQPDEHLLYNTRTQALVKIPTGVKSVVEQGDQQDSVTAARYKEDLDILYRMGLIVNNLEEDVQKIKAHMQQIKSSVDRKSFPVTLLTTYACNLKCSYCFEESSRTNEKMSGETQLQSMTWLKSKLIEQRYNKLYITFYGGEPLANKPAIKTIATHMQQWCSQRDIAFNFMLQTNGYLMTPDLIRQYLKLGLNQVRISVDGVGHEHDKYRPLRKGGGTFDVIMKNIVDCCDLVPIGISVSYEKGEVEKIDRLFDYLDDLGILYKLGRFLFSPIHATLGPEGHPEYIQNSNCMCNYDDKLLVAANRKINSYMNKRGLPMKSGMSTSVCPVTREEGGMTIDQKGYLYKCNSMLGHKEFSIGHVSEAKYNQQHHDFLSLDVWKQCPVDCTYMPMCSGGCRLSSFLNNQHFKRPTCHKPYLNKMARELIIKDYERIMAQQKETHPEKIVR